MINYSLTEDCLADSQSGMILRNFLVMTSGTGVSVHIEEDARLNSVDAIHYFEYLQHITSSSPMLCIFSTSTFPVGIWDARLNYHTLGAGVPCW